MIDRTGQEYGRLVVTAQSGLWSICSCMCGNTKAIRTGSLTSGRTRSCGCLRKERSSQLATARNTVHGESAEYYYVMWESAKTRAKRLGVEFNIEPQDIVIPEQCPVLWYTLSKAVGRASDNSPSLDRIDNSKGYVKGNIRVISHRANTLKGNAEVWELQAIVDYMNNGRELQR